MALFHTLCSVLRFLLEVVVYVIDLAFHLVLCILYAHADKRWRVIMVIMIMVIIALLSAVEVPTFCAFVT